MPALNYSIHRLINVIVVPGVRIKILTEKNNCMVSTRKPMNTNFASAVVCAFVLLEFNHFLAVSASKILAIR